MRASFAWSVHPKWSACCNASCCAWCCVLFTAASAPRALCRQIGTVGRAPLFLVVMVVLLAQLVLLVGRGTFFALFYDSGNYLAVAHRMVAHGAIFNYLRIPVYPGFLAFSLAINVDHPIATAVLVQMGLMWASIFEAYVLAYWLIGWRWAAAIAMVIEAHLYVLQWERTVNSEGMTMWLLITLLLLDDCSVTRWQQGEMAVDW